MADVFQNFEGITSGNTLSLANTNTPGNNAFDSISTGAADSVLIASSTAAYQQASGMRIATRAIAGTPNVLWDTALGGGQAFFASFMFRQTEQITNTNTMRLVNFRPAGGVGLNGGINIGTGSNLTTLRLVNGAGSQVVLGAGTITANQWYRLSVFISASTAVGYTTARLYSDPTAGVASFTEELNANGGTTWAMSAGTTGRMELGILTSIANTPTTTGNLDIDHFVAGKTDTWYGAPAIKLAESVVPTVTGALAVGGTLTANSGTWNPAPSSFTYYWQSADDAAGTNLAAIGSTGSTYTLAAADVNKYIRAGVIPVP